METALAVETLARPAVRAENVSPAPPCNVVILTVGWTGSSMLAGLLRAAGFWTGTTVRNTDYNTFEKALIASSRVCRNSSRRPSRSATYWRFMIRADSIVEIAESRTSARPF
jgi:hypothetical protein